MRSKGRGARDVNGLHRFTRSARSACVASVVALVGTVVGGVVGAAPAVAAGAPTQTVFTVQPPTNVVAGTSFTVEVAIEDSSGNVVTSDSSDSVNLGIEQGPSQLHCTNFGSATVSAGIADFTCSLDTASSAYELYASSPYGFINSNLFAVTAAAPAELSLVMPSVVSAGLPFTASAQMEDAFGNVETTDSSGTVTLSLASGPGGALTCTPSATVPVSSGVANFSCSIGQAGDGYELRATDSVYSFSGSGSLAVNAAPSLGNSKVAVSPNPTILSSDGVASFSVTVTVEDASGNPVVGDTVSLSFNPTGELSFYPPVPQETPGNGVVSWQVTCNAGSCAAGSSVAVTATDTTANLVLGTVNEDFVAADVRTPLGDLTGWAGQQATVSLQGAPAGTSASVTFDGSTVSVSGVCTTDASGGLSQARDTGDCTFTVPVDPNVGSEVPVVISVGNESYTLQFALVSPPTINLSPTSGQAGAVITVSGSGFPADLGTGGATALQVTFTPAGATASSTTANCDTDGTGAITTGTGGTACQLTVPAATPVGAATVAVTGFATATAGFTVTATCATDPAQAACTMTGISIDTGALHNSRKDLYVGETVTLPIDAVYSDGTSALLPVPAGGPYPQVVFTDSAPSGAVAYGGLDASNNGLDINATLVTTSPANIAVTYDGFSAGASVGAETEPCGTKCAFVNGALLTVQAVVPGALGTSTPVSGAVVQITQPPAEVVYGPCGPGSYQNTGCTPVSTLSGATVLSSSTCTTGDNGTDTGDPGQCQVTDAEYGPDWVTLSPPPDYTITGVSGCTNTGATDFECELQPQDFNPETVTFDLQAYPTLTVKAGGPFDNSTGNYDNDLLNGVTATITGPSLDLTCVLEGGQPTTDGLGLGLGGTEASCQVQVAPGTYNVSVGSIVDSSGDYSLPIPYDNSLRIYVTSTDPASEQLNAGDTKTVSFTTAYEPLLQVQVAGPEEAPPPGLTLIHNWDNQDVNGAVVSFSQGANTVATCTLEGGVANFGSVGNPANEQASCQAYLPPGSYAVSVGSQDGSGYYSIASTDPHGVSPFVDVTSTDPLTQELNPGDINSASFTTAFEPQLTVNLGGPEICPNSGGAPGGPCLPMNSSWYNSEVNGTTVNITP
ncbi:MAG TPA: Ig-like domain-containing protein, partial [Acidimicrobiales bacterium]|nr:Ig-like domain-containing protein [Acidimicrobiales bacterium]